MFDGLIEEQLSVSGNTFKSKLPDCGSSLVIILILACVRSVFLRPEPQNNARAAWVVCLESLFTSHDGCDYWPSLAPALILTSVSRVLLDSEPKIDSRGAWGEWLVILSTSDVV